MTRNSLRASACVFAAPISGSDESVTDSGGLLAGFASLVSYLGQLADYLEQTAHELKDLATRLEPDASARIRFIQSLQLRILQSAMVANAPLTAEQEPMTSPAMIERLDQSLGQPTVPEA